MSTRGRTPDPLRQLRNADVGQRAFRRGDGVALHRPIHVYLQIASACNIDCYMCSEHERPTHLRRGRGLRSLPPEIFAKLEREVLPWSTRMSLGVGGEPTISEHFVEYVERGARAGQEIHLTTNGTQLARPAVTDVVARYVRRVQISIDGATEATYERIRLGSRWTRLRHGLELLRARRRVLDTVDRCHVSFCFVLMRSNVDELPAFVELAHELEADEVWAQHVIPATAESQDEVLLLEPERYNRALAAAQARARELGIELSAPQPYPLDGSTADAPAAPPAVSPEPYDSSRLDHDVDHVIPCKLPTEALFVLYDGRVFPCCHPFAHQKMQVGDLSRTSFAEIWNSRTYRNLRAGLHRGDAHPICASCSMAHDPPLAREDSATLLAGPDLEAFYADRDMVPLAAPDPLMLLDSSGWLDWAADVHAHATSLDAERQHLRGHLRTVERERNALRGHAATLERERNALLGHAATLERERDALLNHAANLEHERAVLRVLLERKRGFLRRLRSRLGILGDAPSLRLPSRPSE